MPVCPAILPRPQEFGPGYPDKALPIAKYCKEKLVNLDYVPVDINKVFLEIASQEISKFTNSITPIQAPFAECSNKIPDGFKKDTLVMIGLTFMNFPSGIIIPLMKKIGGKKARALIASEIIKPKSNITSILQRYELPEARGVAFGPLKALGVSPTDVDYKVHFNNSRVEMCFTLRRSLELPKKLAAGSQIVTAVSYRYTEDELRRSIEPYFANCDFHWANDRNTVVAILS